MTRTPLLLVPCVLCSPRLFAAQVAALGDKADIVVPDWRKAPLSIWDSWESAARWVVDQMPAEKFALAGLSLGGMLAVEIAINMNPATTRICGAVFFLSGLFFVRRSFYKMRIPEKVKA